MNKKIFYAGMFLLATAMFWSCSNETGDGPDPDIKAGVEKEVVFSVVSTDSDKPETKAPLHTSGESSFTTTDLKFFVYDSNGNLELEEKKGLDNNKKCKLTVKAGEKYFFVFANHADAPSFSAMPLRKEFERQILPVTCDNDRPSLAVDQKFFMGTLWAGKVTVDSNSDPDNPQNVEIKIGRSVAKVNLLDVAKRRDGYTIVKGTFEDPWYKMGGVALKSYLVGQYTGDNMPPGDYESVTSAVHTSPHIKANGDDNTDDFCVYKNFIKVNGEVLENQRNAFYVTENTTEPVNGLQYYGNTTYIRLRTKYLPAKEELWNADLTAKDQDPSTLVGGTFWTIVVDGQRYICNAEPKVTGDDNPIKYDQGYNYHSVVIRDKDKRTEVKKNAVLRNHYYEVKITGIRDLGDGEIDEKWVTPIPIDVDIEATITVEDWSKIEDGRDI